MSRALVLGALAAVAALLACPTQAPAPCQIQPSANGPYTIKMTNTGTATPSCPAVMGDQWNFDNFANGLIAMASVAVPLPPTASPDASVYGKGFFNSFEPDSSDLCTVPELQRPFDGPNGSTYMVKNLQFLSTALYIGTQWKADITYTPDGGTPCTYSGQAINPSTTCTSNADCNPTSQPTNSGINYLYDQGCHIEDWTLALTGTDAGICFFNKPFPSLGGFHQ